LSCIQEKILVSRQAIPARLSAADQADDGQHGEDGGDAHEGPTQADCLALGDDAESSQGDQHSEQESQPSTAKIRWPHVSDESLRLPLGKPA
jgi:hypothetical protein